MNKSDILKYKDLFSWNKIIHFAPEASWVFVSQAGIAIAGLIGVKILTNLLGPEEYGRLAIANTIILFITLSFFQPFSQGLMRFWSISKEKGNLSIFYQISAKISSLLFYCVLALSVVLLWIARNFNSLSAFLFLGLAFFTGIISGLISLDVGILTASRRRMEVAFLNVSTFLFRPLIAALLIVLIVKNTNVALLGYFIASISVFLLAKLFCRALIRTKKDILTDPGTRFALERKLLKEIISYSWPFLILCIFNWVFSFCDRWVLKILYDNETVGLFSVITQFATWPLIFFFSFLSSFFIPISFEKAGNLTSNDAVIFAAKILILMVILFALISIILVGLFFLFHYQLIKLYSNVHFTKYSYLLPGLTIAWSCYYLGQLFNTFGMVINEPKHYILPRVIMSVFAVIAVLFFTMKAGVVGIVLGLGLAGFIYMIWGALVSFRILKNRFSRNKAVIENALNI